MQAIHPPGTYPLSSLHYADLLHLGHASLIGSAYY